MSPLIQNIEGLSLLLCGILMLFTMHKKGRNRVLLFLAWFFIAGGIFRLGMLLPGWLGAMTENKQLATLVSIVSNSCLYFGIAGYLYMQVRYATNSRFATVTLWIGLLFAAALTTFHTLASDLVGDPLALAATQQPVMLWVFVISALLIIVSLVVFSLRAKKHHTPIISNMTMNIGLGFMLLSWVLQKSVQGEVGVTATTLLSALPFVAVAIILVAVFLQVSSSMTPGMVYHAQTKEPVPLAIVRVIREQDKKMIESRVASAQGRYGILVEPGRYQLSVTAAGYTFPSSVGMGYQGEVFEVSRPMLVGFEIFLDPAA